MADTVKTKAGEFKWEELRVYGEDWLSGVARKRAINGPLCKAFVAAELEVYGAGGEAEQEDIDAGLEPREPWTEETVWGEVYTLVRLSIQAPGCYWTELGAMHDQGWWESLESEFAFDMDNEKQYDALKAKKWYNR